MSCLPTFCLGMRLIGIAKFFKIKEKHFKLSSSNLSVICSESSRQIYSTRRSSSSQDQKCLSEVFYCLICFLAPWVMFQCELRAQNWNPFKLCCNVNVSTYHSQCHASAICSTLCIRNGPGNCLCPRCSLFTTYSLETQQNQDCCHHFLNHQLSRHQNEETPKIGPYMYVTVPFCFLPKCCGNTPDNSWFACTWNQTRTG